MRPPSGRGGCGGTAIAGITADSAVEEAVKYLPAQAVARGGLTVNIIEC